MYKRLDLGPLELKVLRVLWERGGASTVRDVQPSFPELAYTTLMTTLDRLFKKGMLKRFRLARAFGYEPRNSQHEVIGQMVGRHVTDLLAGGSSTALLSTLVQTLGQADADFLDELEALVQAKRAQLATPAS